MVTVNDALNSTTTTFEAANWGVFLKNNNSANPTLVGSVRGKISARKFIASYLEQNPNIDPNILEARSLGKPVQIRLKQVPTF